MAISEHTLLPLLTFTVVHHPVLTVLLSPIVLLIIRSFYRLSPLHSLWSIPGPVLPRLTSIWLNYHAYIGDECTAVHELHQKYGPIVRTGPNSVDISDGNALHQIYVEKGGFLKPAFYGNFDIDGHKSIFSAIDPEHRAPRAKAVTSIFSTANLRAGGDKISAAVDGFIDRVRRDISKTRQGKHTIDILALSRALAIDVVTGYLFDERYGGCEEDRQPEGREEKPGETMNKSGHENLTASGMVDSFVAVGKDWYLSPWAFEKFESLQAYFYPDSTAERSMQMVDEFVTKVVEKATSEKESSTSYPARLLKAGFSTSETHAQCKDLIFAGTDSTAMNLATICFHLIQNPQVYQDLRKELQENNSSSTNTETDLQSLPYLRGVIREGLRLAMANPSRLPRVVPPSGFTFNKTYLPPGTIVSIAPFELHFNPLTFPDPHTFNPSRWLASSNPTEAMNRDHIPFGLGTRQCIARNLATVELFAAVKRIVEEDLLKGLQCKEDRIEILEWFNSHVVGGKVELVNL